MPVSVLSAGNTESVNFVTKEFADGQASYSQNFFMAIRKQQLKSCSQTAENQINFWIMFISRFGVIVKITMNGPTPTRWNYYYLIPCMERNKWLMF